MRVGIHAKNIWDALSTIDTIMSAIDSGGVLFRSGSVSCTEKKQLAYSFFEIMIIFPGYVENL